MLRMLRNRKGQFYILIALLLISYAFTLARQDVPVRRQKDTFQLLHEGYISEAPAAINNAVYEDANVTARLANFTNAYIDFAKSSEAGFRLAYLLKHGDSLTLGNRLGTELNATVGSSGYTVPQNSERTFSASNATLNIGGISYDFSFSEEEIQLKALFRTADRLKTRVFVYG